MICFPFSRSAHRQHLLVQHRLHDAHAVHVVPFADVADLLADVALLLADVALLVADVAVLLADVAVLLVVEVADHSFPSTALDTLSRFALAASLVCFRFRVLRSSLPPKTLHPSRDDADAIIHDHIVLVAVPVDEV